jgi:hypothetical protein
MEYSKEYMEKLELFNDTIKFKPVNRILRYSNFYTWKIFDCNTKFKLSEALVDFDKIEKIQAEFHERYRYDTHMDVGLRNLPIGPAKILGSSHYSIDDVAGTLNFHDHVIMEGDEYEEYAEYPEAVHWRMFHRKHPNITKEMMVKAIMRHIDNGEFSRHMIDKFITEYACPGVMNRNNADTYFNVPIERFHKYYRGIRETSMDLRKHKKELLKACDAIQEKESLPTIRSGIKKDNSTFITDFFTGLLAHATLSLSQWEEFYWPYLKQYFDLIVNSGKTVGVYCENNIGRFAKYFKEYPKGHIAFIVELDDLIELRKELPNICLVGGLTSDLLGHGTPQQCIDQIKRLSDELKEGFILSEDKMMSFKNDCKRENLLAVSEFVQGYRK